MSNTNKLLLLMLCGTLCLPRVAQAQKESEKNKDLKPSQKEGKRDSDLKPSQEEGKKERVFKPFKLGFGTHSLAILLAHLR